MRASEFISEEWSEKYKRSIDCSHPKGFSQRAHCAGRKKNEDLNEFSPGGGGSGGNYLKALASAWYNDTFNTGDLHAGIKSQEDIERILERGIHCGDGKVRKYSIGYNANFDGVEIQSDDHYEYSDYDDAGNDIDSRTGKPWGPYDVVAFAGNELDESQLDEFAPGPDDNKENNPEDVLFRFAKMWYSAPDVATQQRVEQALAKIGWEIGELESEEGGAFVMQTGDEDGNSYLAWSEEQLADQLNELTFLGSQCTKDCSGHRAGYEWSHRQGGRDAASWSPSFNKGAWLQNNGY